MVVKLQGKILIFDIPKTNNMIFPLCENYFKTWSGGERNNILLQNGNDQSLRLIS